MYLKGLFERFFIIPFIDEMIVTSLFVADCVQKYCGREATVIHPVIQEHTESDTYPHLLRRHPLERGTDIDTDTEKVTSPPFKGVA